MPQVGDFQTATLTVDVGDATTTATLEVLAPDGTSSAPAASTPNTGATWNATVSYALAGWYTLIWTVTGAGAGVEPQRVFVEALPAAGEPVAYVGLDLVKVRLKITDSDRDALLTQHIESASRAIDDATGRNPGGFALDAAASARVFNPRGRVLQRRDGELLLVDDIGSLDSLTVEAGDGTDFWPVPSSLYDFWQDNALARGDAIEGLLHRYAFGWSGASAILSLVRQRIRVTARWGWPRVPPTIVEATLIQATRYYLRKDSPEGVAGSSEWGVIRLANLDPDVRFLIGRYKTGAFGGRG